MRNLFSWVRALDELVFPVVPICPVCGTNRISAEGCCAVCLESLAIDWRTIAIHEYSCGTLMPYQGFAREVIHRMKYNDGFELAALFGNLLGLALREDPTFADVDVLVPVPLHPLKLQLRGFNQAAVIADYIRKQWKRPVFEGIVRQRNTSSQSELDYAARRQNVRHAFTMLPGHSVKGEKCLIVDDVITSGWTFQSMAQVILRSGGTPVGVFVARAGKY